MTLKKTEKVTNGPRKQFMVKFTDILFIYLFAYLKLNEYRL